MMSKKLYLTAFAAITAATMFAAPANRAQFNPVRSPHPDRQLQFRSLDLNLDATRTQKLVAPAKVKDYEAIEDWVNLGTGKFTDIILGDEYLQGGPGTFEVTVQESESNPGVYRILDPYQDVVPNTEPGSTSLIIDASNPYLVYVPYQCTGIEDQYDGLIYTCSTSAYMMDVSGNNLSAEEFLYYFADYVITMTDGVITFPPVSILLNWPQAPSDSPYGTDPSEFYNGNNNTTGYLILPGSDLADPWEDYGTAKFFDGHAFVACFEDVTNHEVEVPIQINTKKEGVYRLVNPWDEVFGAALNSYIEFDVTDPTNVLIPMQTTGYTHSSYGTGFYLNTYGAYLGFGYTKDDFLEDAEASDYCTFEDNTVKIPTAATATYFNGVGQFMGKTEENGGTPSYIVLPDPAGIDNNFATPQNSETLFYNLQGVRVNGLQDGITIVIRNGKPTKIVK